MQYLARVRMHQAAQWLRDQVLSVGEAADSLGYASEAAFRRAFKRHLGRSPGEVRRTPRMSIPELARGTAVGPIAPSQQ